MKSIIGWIVLGLLAISLAACGTRAAATQAAETGSDTGSAAAQTGSMPIESKLAIGTLTLEDTDLAVTAEQAQALLPLWKAVRSLSSSDTASQAEIQALYAQIQESMSAEQLAAITALELTGDTTSALMEKLGIEAPMPGSQQDLTAEQRSTLEARFQAQGGGEMPPVGGGEMPGGGGGPMGGGAGQFPPDGAGAGQFPPDGAGDFQGPGNFSGTPDASRIGARRAGLGGNSMFLDPLITMLQERGG